jgi:hypothetical protein
MPALESSISDPGTYEVTTIPGQEYLVCLNSISNFECSLTYTHDAGDIAVADSTFGEADGMREARIVAPASKMSVVCTSLSDEITVTFIPILKS